MVETDVVYAIPTNFFFFLPDTNANEMDAHGEGGNGWDRRRRW